MAVYFVDTSAIVKRYVVETGSACVNLITGSTSTNIIHLVKIAGVEVVSALVRRSRAGTIAAASAAVLLAQFRQEFAQDYVLVDVTDHLLAAAMNLAERHALRGYDAVQLAAALDVQSRFSSAGVAMILVSADAELNAAALAEGLTMDDPNNHP